MIIYSFTYNPGKGSLPKFQIGDILTFSSDSEIKCYGYNNVNKACHLILNDIIFIFLNLEKLENGMDLHVIYKNEKYVVWLDSIGLHPSSKRVVCKYIPFQQLTKYKA